MVCQNHSQLQSAFKGHKDSVSTIAFSQDGQTLASGGYAGKTKLWQVDSAQEIYTMSGHSDRVTSLAFSGDGQTLISASADKRIQIWRCDRA